MVKTPNMRHSKPHREPVTIDLEAESVEKPKSVDASKATGDGASGGSSSWRFSAGQADRGGDDRRVKISEAQKPEFGRDAAALSRPPRHQRLKPEAAKASAPKDPPKPEPKPSIPPRPPVNEPSRGGTVSVIAAGLIGGAVALSAGALCNGQACCRPFGDKDQAALESRINELQSQVAALPTPVDYTGRLDALDSQVKQAVETAAAAGGGSAEAVQAIDQRLKGVEDGLAAANSAIAAASGAAAVDLAPINDRLGVG
jgi:hypothetical protein